MGFEPRVSRQEKRDILLIYLLFLLLVPKQKHTNETYMHIKKTKKNAKENIEHYL